MSKKKQCECKNCQKRKRDCRVLGHLTCGDTIRVFSFGKQLQETGIFLRIEDFFLVWLDEKQQLNQTELQVIHIEKLS